MNLIKLAYEVAIIKMKIERKNSQPSFFNSPYVFISIFLREAKKELLEFRKKHSLKIWTLGFLCFIYLAVHLIESVHHLIASLDEILLFSGFWIGLGVLSSIGLGTGLPTFILYLGPKIVKFVLASNKCGRIVNMVPSRFSLFPELQCPSTAEARPVNVIALFSVICLEAFLWGTGTALGELPPYFISRAARLAGKELEEIEELKSVENKSFFTKIKLKIFDLVKKNSFFTVFFMASFPNPLFDLAGITCGHLLIPFWTFMLATFFGKALVKVNFQTLFFIFVFSKKQVIILKSVLVWFLSPESIEKIAGFLDSQQESILQTLGTEEKPANWLGTIWNFILCGILGYFVISIIDSKVKTHLLSKTD